MSLISLEDITIQYYRAVSILKEGEKGSENPFDFQHTDFAFRTVIVTIEYKPIAKTNSNFLLNFDLFLHTKINSW